MKWLSRFLLNRAREASTWRGLILFFAGSWAAANPEQAEAVIAVAITVAGAIGAFFPDAKKPDLPPIELQSRPAPAPELCHDAVPPVRQAAARSVANPADSASTGSERPGWNG